MTDYFLANYEASRAATMRGHAFSRITRKRVATVAPDPRGPHRRIVHVSEGTNQVALKLDCGHVIVCAPHFTYRKGDDTRCMCCR